MLMSAWIVVVKTALQSNSNVTHNYFIEGYLIYKERNEGKQTEIVGEEQES